MQIKTMQELGLYNEVNLCDSCCDDQPACEGLAGTDNVVFGTGIGRDNIASCSKYNPLQIRNYEAERAGR